MLGLRTKDNNNITVFMNLFYQSQFVQLSCRHYTSIKLSFCTMFKYTFIFCNPFNSLVFSGINNQMNEIKFGYFIALL